MLDANADVEELVCGARIGFKAPWMNLEDGRADSHGASTNDGVTVLGIVKAD
jgi:hypothetical protein